MLRRYLDARWRGDVAAAQELWDEVDVRRAQGLGTTYTGLEERFDDNLLWSTEERTAAARAGRPAVRDSTVDGGWARFTVLVPRPAAAGADTLRWFLRQTPGGWRVSSPMARVAGGWSAREGRWFRLRAARLRDVNRDALAALDAGIERFLARLGTPEMTRLRLERLRFEFYVCSSDAEARELGGAGYRLAGERIVTRSAADLNAAARAVVHLALKEAPPHAAPFLEAGLAAALGGWGEESADVVLQRAAVAIAGPSSDPGSVLDAARMRAAEPEKAIPLAAMWAEALLRDLGPERFLALYRTLSGSATRVAALDAAAVRRELEKATGRRGAALDEWLRARAAATTAPLAAGCARIPEETREHPPIVRWRDLQEAWALEVHETGGEYTFVLGPYQGSMPRWAQRLADSLAAAQGRKIEGPPPGERPRPIGDPPHVAILVRDRLVAEPEAYESALFHRHFSRRRYADELLGLFVSPDGAQLWDYRRDLLVGVHDPELALPDAPVYYDQKAGRICFRLRRDLFAKPLGEYMAVTLLYTGE